MLKIAKNDKEERGDDVVVRCHSHSCLHRWDFAGLYIRTIIMSLDKAISHGKERRKPYRGSKAFDPSCRNHGSCLWCEENRKFKFRDKYTEGEDEWITEQSKS